MRSKADARYFTRPRSFFVADDVWSEARHETLQVPEHVATDTGLLDRDGNMTWLALPLFGLPRWLWGLIAIVLAVIAFTVWVDAREKAAVAADRAVSNAEAVSKARVADEAAHGAVEAKREETHDAVERAKAAADGSDDPLRAGLDSLRAGKSGADQAPR